MKQPHAVAASQKGRKQAIQHRENARQKKRALRQRKRKTYEATREERFDSEVEDAVEEFFEEIKDDTEIISVSAIKLPFELAFHFAGEFSVFFTIIAIGFVWVLVWTLTVAFAAWVLNMFGFLNFIFLAFIAWIDIIAAAWQTLFAVVFYVVKFVACEFPLISNAIGPAE